MDSPLLQSRIVGTTSAKLSYLISQIVQYYQHEKILVFYDGDNAAYYIAQMLDALHIKHEIYAKSLKASQKSEYAVRFDQEAQDRVLLMDVRQAAFGLNLPAASRIYFVNPVCRENIEAQAIKRAHRIGQKKAVHVETLVLKGTVEEKMLDRSKRMTRAEHLNASHLEDDGGIKQIIQSAAPLPVEEALQLGRPQMAPLDVPQQVWCREGWREYQHLSHRGPTKKRKAANDPADEGEAKAARRKKVVRRTLAFVDCRSSGQDGATAPGAESSSGASSSAPHDRSQAAQASSGASLATVAVEREAPEIEPLREPGRAAEPSISSTSAQHAPDFRKASISTLMNDGPERPAGMDDFASNDLMQEILRRL